MELDHNYGDVSMIRLKIPYSRLVAALKKCKILTIGDFVTLSKNLENELVSNIGVYLLMKHINKNFYGHQQELLQTCVLPNARR